MNSSIAALESSFAALTIYENSRVQAFVTARVEIQRISNI